MACLCWFASRGSSPRLSTSSTPLYRYRQIASTRTTTARSSTSRWCGLREERHRADPVAGLRHRRHNRLVGVAAPRASTPLFDVVLLPPRELLPASFRLREKIHDHLGRTSSPESLDIGYLTRFSQSGTQSAQGNSAVRSAGHTVRVLLAHCEVSHTAGHS